MSTSESVRLYNWQEEGDFSDTLPSKQLSIAHKFLDIMSRDPGDIIAMVDQQAAVLKGMLAERGIDTDNPREWFCLLEGTKLFDQIMDSQLRTREQGPSALAEFDYQAQDRVWQVVAALAPLSVRNSQPYFGEGLG